MTSRRHPRHLPGRMARRASAVTTCFLMMLAALVAVAPTAPAAVLVPARTVSVATGFEHTCALTTAGGVKCWGDNFFGQLGLGPGSSRRSHPVPVDVPGLTSGVAQISAANNTTCAVTTAGGVKCWGDGSSAQLGNGSKPSNRRLYSLTPVDVTGLTSGVRSVTVGKSVVCAVTTAGAVKCWGVGALISGSSGFETTPVDVPGLSSGVRAITVAEDHLCVLTATGASCWGGNQYGQLGNGTLTDSTVPVRVATLGADVTSLSAGYGRTCATTSGTGRTYCWGDNSRGLLLGTAVGDAVTAPHPLVGLHGLTGFSSISVDTGGVVIQCGVKLHTYCWGFGQYGGLGNGTTDDRTTPVAVAGLPATTMVSTSGYHACAVTTLGKVFCWGSNLQGELGDGTTVDALTPVRVLGSTA